MRLDDVLEQLANRLMTISGLNVFAFPPDALSPPAAVVSYPDSYEYDKTYKRGIDRLKLPVVVVVGRVSDRASRKELAAYCDGSGPSSIKSVLESGTYTAFHEVVVESVEFGEITVGAVTYAGAIFTLDVVGSGA